MGHSRSAFQVSRFRKRVLDDSLAILGVPNFIAFEGVPLVFAKFGVPSRETSADWCAAEKHVKDWLLKQQPNFLRNLWLAQRSSRMNPRRASFLLFRWKTAPRTPGPARPAARRKKQVTMAWCHMLQTRKQFLDCSSTKLTNSLLTMCAPWAQNTSRTQTRSQSSLFTRNGCVRCSKRSCSN